MKKQVEKMIEELKNSPLYTMSLGSRELYHSNFWAWLMRKNPYMINVFFENLIEVVEKGEKGFKIIAKGKCKENIDPLKLIERENANTDIKIQLDNDVYIIENKIKTLPYREQLLKYQYQSKGFQNGCYTGLVDPNFSEEEIEFECKKEIHKNTFQHKDWSFVSYSTISKRITAIMDQNDKGWFNCFEREIINKYCEDISNINTIISEKIPSNNVQEFKFEKDLALDNIRLEDVYQKLKADIFKKNLHEKLKNQIDSKINGYELKIQSNFTRKTPLVEVFYRKGKDDLIGIQLQGTQYRRCFSKWGGKDLENTFNSLNGKWFCNSFTKSEKRKANGSITFNGRKYVTSQTGNYCSYKPSFIYQYGNLDDKNWSFDAIRNAIKSDMETAKQILSELNL